MVPQVSIARLFLVVILYRGRGVNLLLSLAPKMVDPFDIEGSDWIC